MRDVFHDRVHGPRKVDFVFIDHGNTNEEFRLSCRASDVLTQLVAFRHEIVWVTSNRRVPHMCKLHFISPRQETVKNRRNFTLKNELSINESDLLLCHLRCSGTSSLLAAIWRGTIMLIIGLWLLLVS